MANPHDLRTVVYRAARQPNGTLELYTNDGRFRTAKNSQASTQLRVGEFPGGLPVTLHIGTRGTVVKVSL